MSDAGTCKDGLQVEAEPLTEDERGVLIGQARKVAQTDGRYICGPTIVLGYEATVAQVEAQRDRLAMRLEKQQELRGMAGRALEKARRDMRQVEAERDAALKRVEELESEWESAREEIGRMEYNAQLGAP